MSFTTIQNKATASQNKQFPFMLERYLSSSDFEIKGKGEPYMELTQEECKKETTNETNYLMDFRVPTHVDVFSDEIKQEDVDEEYGILSLHQIKIEELEVDDAFLSAGNERRTEESPFDDCSYMTEPDLNFPDYMDPDVVLLVAKQEPTEADKWDLMMYQYRGIKRECAPSPGPAERRGVADMMDTTPDREFKLEQVDAEMLDADPPDHEWDGMKHPIEPKKETATEEYDMIDAPPTLAQSNSAPRKRQRKKSLKRTPLPPHSMILRPRSMGRVEAPKISR